MLSSCLREFSLGAPENLSEWTYENQRLRPFFKMAANMSLYLHGNRTVVQLLDQFN